MKKTLIALAAVAVSSAAFAQSSVSITGNLNISAVDNGKITTQGGDPLRTTSQAATETKTSATGLDNGWTASEVRIAGTEDLGGGLRASFVFATGLGGGASTFADRDRSLALSGNFGTVRIGRINTAAASGYHALSGSPSPSVGSLYGLMGSSAAQGNRWGGVGFTVNPASDPSTVFLTALSSGNFERQNNQIQYTSPTINGFTVNVNYGVNSSDTSVTGNRARTTQTGLHIGYADGPIAVGFGMNRRKATAEDVAAAHLGAEFKGDLNWLAGSYDFGVARVFAAHVQRKDTANGALRLIGDNTPVAGSIRTADISVNQIGVSVPVNAFTFTASMYRGSNDRDVDAGGKMRLTGYQLTARYALSNRTSIYALAGENKIDSRSAATSQNRKETTATFGVMHTF